MTIHINFNHWALFDVFNLSFLVHWLTSNRLFVAFYMVIPKCTTKSHFHKENTMPANYKAEKNVQDITHKLEIFLAAENSTEILCLRCHRKCFCCAYLSSSILVSLKAFIVSCFFRRGTFSPTCPSVVSDAWPYRLLVFIFHSSSSDWIPNKREDTLFHHQHVRIQMPQHILKEIMGLHDEIGIRLISG